MTNQTEDFKAILEDKELNSSNNLESYCYQYLIDYSDNKDEITSHIEDILYGGCVRGCVSPLIYYKDTYKFFDTYYNEIQEIMDNLECDLNSILKGNDLKNTLAWLSFEETIRTISYELELDV